MPPREPTATDLPATRTSGAPSQATGREWLWALLSLACLALALASYEQAVVLPVALLGVGLLFQLGGHRIRWPWHAASWALLLLYLAIRKLVLPAGVSGYQLQQFRHGVTVAWSIARYVFPASFDARDLLFGGLSGALLLSLEPLRQAWAVSANVVAYLQIRRRLWVGLCAYALSVGSFLPMAWLKPFEHYHYLPMAFRALFVAVLAAVCFDLSVTAVSPRARQAPPRPSPAPGSLLRP
ncbi:MAG: hypothetical protein HY248_06830 [Fimbriimonas ginsengisoli]|nr:hypothetical protein [Fimbriimonas ginsengisoli]